MDNEELTFSNPLVPITIKDKIGMKRFINPTSLRQVRRTIDTTDRVVVEKNPNRVALMVVNNSSGIAYCSFEPQPSVLSMFRLDADGGAMSMCIDDDGEAVCHEIYGYISAGSGYIDYAETIIDER